MTRTFVVLTVGSGLIAWFDLAGLRWIGGGCLAVLTALAVVRIHRANRRRLALRTIEGLRCLPPDEFEKQVARWLRRDGWNVEQRGGSGDRGIDIVARRRNETLAVQCKRYRETAAVGASQVRDLYGAAVAEGVTGAILVTTGRVSGPAVAWAAALPAGIAVTFHDRDCVGLVAAGRARVA